LRLTNTKLHLGFSVVGKKHTINASKKMIILFLMPSLVFIGGLITSNPSIVEGQQGQFHYPFGIAIDQTSGNVYVADTFNQRIEKFTDTGEYIRTWGTPCIIGTGQGCIDEDGPGPLLIGSGEFYYLFGIAIDQTSGNVYVADTGNNRIQVFTRTGNFIGAWGSFGTDNGQLYNPFGIAIDQTSGNVYVADTFNQRIQIFTRTGNFIGAWNTGT
jgi:tripartite motif-containing protein 71